MTKAEREARTVIYEMKRKHALTFSFRHVKGHSNRPEARYVTNNMCDLRARAGMELARKKHGGKNERD